MVFKYRYMPGKYIVISFFLTLSSFMLMAVIIGFEIFTGIDQPVNEWRMGISLLSAFIVVIPFYIINNKIIKTKCVWDEVTIDGSMLKTSRYGEFYLHDINGLKINDLSRVYSFSVKVGSRKLKFSCLNFFGDDGGSKYSGDKIALKAIAENLLQLASSPNYNITVGKESSSGILFVLSCIAMIMLIPGFIYAPQRMIFVAPFVIPLFFVLWKKRQSDNAKQNKSTNKDK